MGLSKDIHVWVFFGRPITSAALSRAYMFVMLPGFVGGYGSHVYFDKQRRFFPLCGAAETASGPGTDAMTACGNGQGKVCFPLSYPSTR